MQSKTFLTFFFFCLPCWLESVGVNGLQNVCIKSKALPSGRHAALMEVFKISLSELQMQGDCRWQEKRDLRTLHVFSMRYMSYETRYKMREIKVNCACGGTRFLFKTTNISDRNEFMAKYKKRFNPSLKQWPPASSKVPKECKQQHCMQWEITFLVLPVSWRGLRICLVHPALFQLTVRWPGEPAALLPGSMFSPCDGTQRGSSGSPSWYCKTTNNREKLS